MRKIACLIISVCVSGSGLLLAQGSPDAYKLSQTDINGTARYLGMGGAFGALGGDISSMYTNPAGLGIYRSSEIVGTVSLNMFNTGSNWNGSKSDMNKTTFNLDNFAYAGYFPTGRDEGIIGWNFGFTYNKLKNFNRTFTVSGVQDYSLADYTAAITTGIEEKNLQYRENQYDPYFDSGIGWMSILGYEGGYLYSLDEVDNKRYASIFGNKVGNQWVVDEPSSSKLLMREWGGIDQYNFSFATNISDIVYVGAGFGVTDINYRMSSSYDETFNPKENLYLDNHFSTDGTGYNFNIGVIVRPVDFLRLGVAYNSPTWYKLTDYFHATAGTILQYEDGPSEVENTTPDYMANDYRFRTPDKWIFSLAGVIGQNALISVDYELSNFKQAKFQDQDGYEPDYYQDVNSEIREDYQNVNTLKVGAEYKITPRFAVRLGGSWKSSSAKTHYKNNSIEIFPAGTIPQFTVDRGTTSLSAGFGYRFTPNVYMDIAYVYRQYKENSYMFSNVYFEDPKDDVYSEAATLKTNTSRIALTVGYKF